MQEFFEAHKESLTPRQVQLVKLMTPVVQECWGSSSASIDEIEKSLIANIEQIQSLMGKISAGIVIVQNEKITKAIDDADKSPYSGY